MMENAQLAVLPGPTRPRLYGVVETYMRKRISGDLHSAFKALRDHREAVDTLPQIASAEETEPKYECEAEPFDCSDHAEISLDELYRDAEEERQRFKEAVEAYEEKTQNTKYKTGIRLDSNHTWEEVLEKVEVASEIYNDDSGFWRKIRKGLRRFGKTNDVFKAWAELLPSQSQYLSIICGGFKLIFGAAARLQDLRDDICDALSEIPVLLAKTHRAIGAFRKSKSLRRCSVDLYVATLVALNHIVLWYRQKAMKKLFKGLLKQSSYENELCEKIQAIENHAQRFDDCAKLCSYEKISQTHHAVASHRKEWLKTQQNIIGHLDRSRYETSEGNSFLRNSILGEAGNMQKTLGAMSNRIKTLEGTLSRFLASNERIVYRAESLREPMLPLRKVASESKMIDKRLAAQRALLSILDYDVTVLERDLETKLRIVWTLPRSEQDRIVAIMLSPKLHRWITGATSSALLINGNHQDSSWQHPTSFICAKLIDSIQPLYDDAIGRRGTTFALAFFCGEHLQRGDPDRGVDGMMRSLLAQLLASYPKFDLDIVQRITDIQPDDVSELCDTFFTLIEQLPTEVVVFCILDGISLYEDSTAICEEARLVMQMLVDLTALTEKHGCAFKPFLMSSQNSRALYKELRDQEADVIWIPARIPSTGGFTAARWDASIRFIWLLAVLRLKCT